MRRAVLETMLAHARAHSLRECCGALLGRAGDPRVVERARPLANEAPSPEDAYLIEASALRRAERHARRAGLEVVGFYHSHPGSPTMPSSLDLEAAWPWYTYAIVGIGGDVAAWRLRADRSDFEQEELEWIA